MKNSPPHRKTIAFRRRFPRFSGGHLKVWHYFCHTKESPVFHPTIHLVPGYMLDATNPWISNAEPIQEIWEPRKADAFFLAGMDWTAVPEDCATPAINLVQGIRHADPADPRHGFLSRRAIRICVSKEVELAILATGKVNGPVVTIPTGMDLDELPEPSHERDIPLLICGIKKPELAIKLSCELAGLGIAHRCQAQALPRREFLSLLGRAAVTVFLPHAREGFYLPALEGMAMGTVVVCPDCVGNRGFCIDGNNCFMPDYSPKALIASCLEALNSDMARIKSMQKNSLLTAELHNLEAERKSYLGILESLAFAEV